MPDNGHRDARVVRRHRRSGRRAVGMASVLTLAASACGGGATPEIDPTSQPEGAAVAPACEEADDLVAAVPDDHEPTGTTAEAVDDPLLPDEPEPDEPPAEQDDGPATAGEAPPELGQQLQQWGEQEAPESFAGTWVDQELGGYAVAFTTDVERYAAEVRERFHPGIAVAEADSTYAQLRDTQEAITREMSEAGHAESGAVRGVGDRVTINRTTVMIFDPDQQRLAELSERHGASTICFEVEEPPGPIAEGLDPLAKASDWREELVGTTDASAVIEIADDRESAERAWQENVDDDLEPRDDELPAEPGLYGGLDDVDFDRQAVVVWSSGESGSCPGWLADIGTHEGVVHVQRDATGQMCTSDYNSYRMILAVDRDRLPSADALPHEHIEGVPDGEVRPYPTN